MTGIQAVTDRDIRYRQYDDKFIVCFKVGLAVYLDINCEREKHNVEDGYMVELEKADALHKRLERLSESVGNLLVDAFQYLALFAIGSAIMWSAAFAFLAMVSKGHTSIADILTLFIYLELGAMVGIYFKTNHMPVRFLIYVAITALTRMLIGNIQADHEPDVGIIFISGAILLLAIANLAVRYSSFTFPSAKVSENEPD